MTEVTDALSEAMWGAVQLRNLLQLMGAGSVITGAMIEIAESNVAAIHLLGKALDKEATTAKPPPVLDLQTTINLKMQCLQVIAQSAGQTAMSLEKLLIASEFLCLWLQGRKDAGDYKAYMKSDIMEPG